MTQEHQLRSDIASVRLGHVPTAPWQELTEIFRSAGAQEATAYYVATDGTVSEFETSNQSDKFQALREQMSTPEHGTWYSAKVIVTPDGDNRFSFDYDNEPRWDQEPAEEQYLSDFARHPRPKIEIPPWHPAADQYWDFVTVDNAGLKGRLGRLLTDEPTDDAGVPVDFAGARYIRFVDDQPNATITVRVHPLDDPAAIGFVRYDQLAVRNDKQRSEGTPTL